MPCSRPFYSSSSTPCTADLNPVGTPCAPGSWLPLTDAVDPALVRSIKVQVDFPGAEKFQPGDSLSMQFRTRTTPTARRAHRRADRVQHGRHRWLRAQRHDRPQRSRHRGSPRRSRVPDGRHLAREDRVGTGCRVRAELVPGAAHLHDRRCSRSPVCPRSTSCPARTPSWSPGCRSAPSARRPKGSGGRPSTIIGTATVGLDTEDIGLVSVENVYDVAALRIRKVVDAAGLDADGNPIAYGPFAFAVDCTFQGQPAYATGYSAANPMTSQLTPEQTWALGGLPVGAACTVDETDDLGATSTSMTITGDGPVETVDGTTADVVIDEDVAVSVTATNAFARVTCTSRRCATVPPPTTSAPVPSSSPSSAPSTPERVRRSRGQRRHARRGQRVRGDDRRHRRRIVVHRRRDR